MAYQMSARQFFEGPLTHHVATLEALRQLGGVIEFAIGGDEGGTWSVDLGRGSVESGRAMQPSCIVRAQALDFMALVEGRMSISDGLLTDRLSLTGDVQRLGQLMIVLGAVGDLREP